MQSKGQGNGGGFVEVARKGRMRRLTCLPISVSTIKASRSPILFALPKGFDLRHLAEHVHPHVSHGCSIVCLQGQSFVQKNPHLRCLFPTG